MQGSAEAIAASLEALSSEIVSVKAIQAGLGAITTSDVDNAISMGAKIVGFNVKPANGAVDSQAKQKDIQIVKHNIIYHLLQEVCNSNYHVTIKVKTRPDVRKFNMCPFWRVSLGVPAMLERLLLIVRRYNRHYKLPKGQPGQADLPICVQDRWTFQ